MFIFRLFYFMGMNQKVIKCSKILQIQYSKIKKAKSKIKYIKPSTPKRVITTQVTNKNKKILFLFLLLKANKLVVIFG